MQLSRSACRKQLNKALNFAKDLVTEQETLLKALNQRQQETKAVKKIGTDIANRMDSLKFQIKVNAILFIICFFIIIIILNNFTYYLSLFCN